MEAEIISHVHHLSPDPNIPLPPVEAGRRLSSSPNPSLTSDSKGGHLDSTEVSTTPPKPTLDTNVTTSMNSAGSMQTPPPTSTSASRRKAQQAQVARLVKESAEKGRRMSSPSFAQPNHVEASLSQVGESPQQFQALQFSPEGFGFAMSGPATAPVYPQHKLFWEPDQGGDTMNMDFAMDDTFTAFGIQKNLDPFTSAEDLGNAIQFPTSPGFNLLGTSSENVAPFPSTRAETSSRTATSVTMARIPSRGRVVNPSLLFSSPSRAGETSSMPSSSQTIQEDILKPYALQLRDAQIEMEMQNSRRPKRKRGPESGDSPAVKAALQTLREDGIDGAGSKGDADELANRRTKSRNSTGSKEGRRPSQLPLQKQRSRTNLHMAADRSQARKRTSVTLTIDASGRAKTEARVMGEPGPSSRMDVDSDEDSESSSSSSSAGMVMSQPQSFAYPPPKQKLPALGRFAADPRSHSQKSSYASTKTSSSTARILSESTNQRRPSSMYMQSSSQHSQASYNDAPEDDDESEASTVVDSDDDKGDAQSELKKIIRSRSSQKKPSRRSILPGPRHVIPDQRRPYPSQGTSRGPYYLSDSMTPGNRYNDPYSNISPTTITDPDLATPSTGRSNLSSSSVRCVYESCHDDGRLMIQWYLHSI